MLDANPDPVERASILDDPVPFLVPVNPRVKGTEERITGHHNVALLGVTAHGRYISHQQHCIPFSRRCHFDQSRRQITRPGSRILVESPSGCSTQPQLARPPHRTRLLAAHKTRTVGCPTQIPCHVAEMLFEERKNVPFVLCRSSRCQRYPPSCQRQTISACSAEISRSWGIRRSPCVRPIT